MRKVAIITLNGYFNYGNRLQNYALQEAIKKTGLDVDTVLLERYAQAHNISTLDKMKGKNLAKLVDIFKEKIAKKIHQDIEKERTKIFIDFTRNYISETDYRISENSIPSDLVDRYSHFVTGSDQVWNPSSRQDPSIFFLNFARKEQRIAYSPSFGVSSIKPEQQALYKKLIEGMHRLSVRENEGSKIIKDLTGLDAPVHVDPTLLLTKEEWLKVAKPAKKKPEKSVLLTYFLGGIPTEHRSKIEKIAKENNLEIVNLGDRKDKNAYVTGPSEFLDYINTAALFCTDSFHGAVFSIIFNTPFIVYKRRGPVEMYSRMSTLVKKFNFESRQIDQLKDSEIFEVDFSHTEPIIKQEQAISYAYLNESLEVGDTLHESK